MQAMFGSTGSSRLRYGNGASRSHSCESGAVGQVVTVASNSQELWVR